MIKTNHRENVKILNLKRNYNKRLIMEIYKRTKNGINCENDTELLVHILIFYKNSLINNYSLSNFHVIYKVFRNFLINTLV